MASAKVTITSPSGEPLDAVVATQPFIVTVTLPFNKDTFAVTVPVTVKTAKGEQTLTLAMDKDARSTGVVYKSTPVTMGKGAEGGDTVEVPDLKLDPDKPLLVFPSGGIGAIDVANGGDVTFSAGGASATVKKYDTDRKLTVARQEHFLTAAGQSARTVAMKLRDVHDDSPAVQSAKLWADQTIYLVEHAYEHMNRPDNSDVERVNWGNCFISLIQSAGHKTWQELYIEEEHTVWQTQNNIRADWNAALLQWQKDFAIGLYQFAIAQCPFVESTFMLLSGQNILGQKLEGWERVVAALGLTQEVLMFAASIKFSQMDAVAHTTPRIARDYAVVGPQGKLLSSAPPGTLVRTPEDFGMLGTQAREINRVISLKADEWGHPVFAKFRSSGPGAVEHLASGLPGKPEPIKGKSINKVDIEGGWAKAVDGAAKPTQNTIGYFTPQQVADAIGVPLDKFPKRVEVSPGEFRWEETPPPPDGVSKTVWDRAVQRHKEYFDEGPMMAEIFDRGLAGVNEYGQLIDKGVTAYKLDEHHQIVPRGHGDPKGTGTAIASDPDPYIFVDGNGVPLPPSKTADLVDALNKAGVMHGAVAEWFPHEAKNLGIQKAILGKHAAKIKVTKSEGGQLEVEMVAPEEGLIVFGGYGNPTKVGWGNVPTSGLSKPTRAPIAPNPATSGTGKSVAGSTVRTPGQRSRGAGTNSPSAVGWAFDPQTGNFVNVRESVIPGEQPHHEDAPPAPVGVDIGDGGAVEGILAGLAAEFGGEKPEFIVQTDVQQPELPPGEVFTPTASRSSHLARNAMIGLVAVAVLVGGLVVATRNGDGSSARSATVAAPHAPSKQSSQTPAGPAAPAASAQKPNTVLDGCQDVENDGTSSKILWFFLTDPVAPGQYNVSMTTGIGVLPGAATAPAGATFVLVPVPITQFTSITNVDITGPGGPIDASFFNMKLPFTLDTSTDHSIGCDGSKLKVPAAAAPVPAAGTANMKQQITDFLNSVADNTHTQAGADKLVKQLNQAVIDRYGLDTCGSFLKTTVDPTDGFSVLAVSGPGPYDYTSDGQTAIVQDVFTVDVQHTQSGRTTQQTTHIARNGDGTFSFFTRCRS